ncbi:hypothetical protein GQ42DRAFT_165310 [Ramicandelaber brevisporus]|nr:hypothetical protein GQ42DRAFT_165310 [Ramicandelaber brevisporus]
MSSSEQQQPPPAVSDQQQQQQESSAGVAGNKPRYESAFLPKSGKVTDSPNEIETYWQLMRKKASEQPLVVVGCAATVGALCMAMYKVRTANKASANRWFQMRILAQFGTLGLLGLYWYKDVLQKQQALGIDNEAQRVSAAAQTEEKKPKRIFVDK